MNHDKTPVLLALILLATIAIAAVVEKIVQCAVSFG